MKKIYFYLLSRLNIRFVFPEEQLLLWKTAVLMIHVLESLVLSVKINLKHRFGNRSESLRASAFIKV